MYCQWSVKLPLYVPGAAWYQRYILIDCHESKLMHGHDLQSVIKPDSFTGALTHDQAGRACGLYGPIDAVFPHGHRLSLYLFI